MRCNSDTQPVISHSCEAAIAPLVVASPQFVQGVSELEKDLPAVMDCTTLALVDAASSQSTSPLAENQNCGFEPKDCHGGACAAAPVAQNLTDLEEQTQHSLSTSLLAENQDCGVEPTIFHEGTGSAAPIAQNEKSLTLFGHSGKRKIRAKFSTVYRASI
ncbi:MAG: hypothetical protein V7L27_17295 [Nostoc sp.]|uniref:hypothetical protein n=1 Tax=Nostoc sp. TaxID=1180 RepID=UPI002FF94E97